jgi:hypothetical protein
MGSGLPLRGWTLSRRLCSDSHGAIGAPNVGGLDDHRHSGELSASPLAPFGIRSSGSGWGADRRHRDVGHVPRAVAVREDSNAATIMPLVQTASALPMLHCDSRSDLSEMTAGRGEVLLLTVSPPGAGQGSCPQEAPRARQLHQAAEWYGGIVMMIIGGTR